MVGLKNSMNPMTTFTMMFTEKIAIIMLPATYYLKLGSVT